MLIITDFVFIYNVFTYFLLFFVIFIISFASFGVTLLYADYVIGKEIIKQKYFGKCPGIRCTWLCQNKISRLKIVAFSGLSFMKKLYPICKEITGHPVSMPNADPGLICILLYIIS